jgi:hypothetical protein
MSNLACRFLLSIVVLALAGAGLFVGLNPARATAADDPPAPSNTAPADPAAPTPDPNAQPAPSDPGAKPAPPSPDGRRERRGGGGQWGGGGGAGRAGGPVNVEASMKEMARALRALRQQVGDAAKKDDNLRLIGVMQEACVACKNAPVPAKVLKEAKDDAAKAKITETYRRNLLGVLRTLADAEEAILDGKADQAKAHVEDLIDKRKKGHETMGVDD